MTNPPASRPGAKPGHTKLYPGPGFRLRYDDTKVEPNVAAGLQAFESPEVSDLQNRLYTMNSAIRAMTELKLTCRRPKDGDR